MKFLHVEIENYLFMYLFIYFYILTLAFGNVKTHTAFKVSH